MSKRKYPKDEPDNKPRPGFDVAEKTFFITGGAQGLGKLLSEAALKAGAKVFFVDIQSDKGTKTLKELQSTFGRDRVAFSNIDVSNRTALQESFKAAVKKFGFVDVLLNNAAVLDESKPRRTLEVNLLAPIEGTEIACTFMRKDKKGRGGRIINMSSVSGLSEYYQMPTYCTTKHAMRVYSTAQSKNPLNKSRGLEFASFHPDASTVGIFSQLSHRNIQDVEQMSASYEGKLTSTGEIAAAFMELVTLRSMNGAVLYAGRGKKEYVKVTCQELGETFPPK